MRYLIIILLLIFTSCKNDSKTEIINDVENESTTENEIDSSVYEMWNNYTNSNPEFKNSELPESWYFHNNEEDANRLAELIVNGKKKTSSSLYSMYKKYGADLPTIGTKHIITDFNGKAQAIIEIKKVNTIPFNQISIEHAELDMGTNIEPLKNWKKAHWDFFASMTEKDDEKLSEEMLIVCERFETIWTKDKN